VASVNTRPSRALKSRVKAAFQEAYEGQNVFVDVSSGYAGRVHVIVVGERFERMTEEEKQKELWRVAREGLAEDAQRISMLLAYGPSDVRAIG